MSIEDILFAYPRFLRGYQIKRPYLAFDPVGTALAPNPFTGFRRYARPYDLENRKFNDTIHIAIVSPRHYVDALLSAIEKLKFGSTRFPGMNYWFKVNLNLDPDNDVFIMDNIDINRCLLDTYECANIYDTFLKDNLRDLRNYDIISVVIPHTPVIQIDTPYYRSKAILASEGLPSQMITFEILRDKNRLEWSLGNIALQIYVKLGGIPWVLYTPHNNFTPIFTIGFDYTIRRYSLAGKPEEIVGYAILFNPDGRYYYLKGLPIVGEENFQEEFIKLLNEIIGDIRREFKEFLNENNIICIHYYRKIKRETKDSIRELMDNYGLKYVLLRVSKNMTFRIFDDSHHTYLPQSGTVVRLDKKLYLLLTAGRLKNVGLPIGTPRPILIEILDSNIDDLDETMKLEIIAHTYYLSFMNWRTLRIVNSFPATMIYATLIARIAKSLQKTKYWERIVGNKQLMSTPWFV